MTEIKSPLTARLYATDGWIVCVTDIRVPSPASGGRIKVEIPYPQSEPARTVRRVILVNNEAGFIARSLIERTVVEPGDTLTVEFGLEHVTGDFLSLFSQNPAEAAAARLEAAFANLASLNDIIAEMTARVSDDPEFTAMVRELLRGHSRALGFQFQGDEGEI